jgi:hypothetical protein
MLFIESIRNENHIEKIKIHKLEKTTFCRDTVFIRFSWRNELSIKINAATKIERDTNSESLIVYRRIAEVRVVSIDAATMATGKITLNI